MNRRNSTWARNSALGLTLAIAALGCSRSAESETQGGSTTVGAETATSESSASETATSEAGTSSTVEDPAASTSSVVTEATAPPTSAPSDFEVSADAFSVVLPDALARSGPIETPCGVVASALTGNGSFFPADGATVVPGVTSHDLRWNGSEWADTPVELVEPIAVEDYFPLAIGQSTTVAVGPAAPDGVRLTVLEVWEEPAYGTVERLDDSCNWVVAQVVFPCGADTLLGGEFRRGVVLGGGPNELVDDGSVLVGSPVVNWSIDAALPQPNCYSDGPHALRWQPSIFAFQALPTSSSCPNGFVPEGAAPIRMCEQGPLVSSTQQYLVDIGFSIDVDGLFGPGTQRALVGLQQQTAGLAVTGVLDAETLAYIGSGGGDV